MKFFTTSFIVCLVALLSVCATFPFEAERRLPTLAFNTQVAHLFGMPNGFLPNDFQLDDWAATPTDSLSTAYNVLLFNYSVYDSLYGAQMKQFLSRELPGATISEYKNESYERFERLLEKQQAVVITYPSGGDPEMLSLIGKKLETFVRNGGLVVITGTHETDALQSLGLLQPDEAYYYEDAAVQHKRADHAVVKGIQNNFSLSNFIYPMSFSEPDFVTISEAEGLPVVGYKELGEGKIAYLGMEYYSDEAIPSKILGNLFKWAISPAQAPPTKPELTPRTPLKRTEEILYTGSTPKFDLKIYPNPYVEKAALEINLDKQTVLSAEVTDETGAQAAVLLPSRSLAPGFYRLEIPNLNPGIYFVQCKLGNHIEVRKVVKMASN